MDKKSFEQKLLENIISQVEEQYSLARKKELEDLHNALVTVIADHQASPQNTLLVLKVIETEVLQDCVEKFFEK